MRLPMLKHCEPIKMAISYSSTYTFTSMYTCTLAPTFTLSETLRISQTHKYSYFLSHILFHVFPNKIALTQIYTHFSPILSHISLHTFSLFLPLLSHTQSCIHNFTLWHAESLSLIAIMSLTHSYTLTVEAPWTQNFTVHKKLIFQPWSLWALRNNPGKGGRKGTFIPIRHMN